MLNIQRSARRLQGLYASAGHVRVEVAPDGESLVLTSEPEVRELEHLPESSQH